MARTHGDRADATDKVRLLKKQLDSEKRSHARTQKDLRKAYVVIEELRSALRAEDEPETSRKREGEIPCDNCKRDTVHKTMTIPLRNGTKNVYMTCTTCGHRKAQK